jgi:integrase
MDEASAATVIKKFRTIFNQAVDQDILSRNPFKQVKIKTKSPRKERLTMEQVKTIFTLNLNLWPFLSVYRDIFLFSVFTGLAYKDAMELKWTNLHERSDGNIKLTITRTKSDVITECFLPKQAIEIARKYRVCHDPENAYKVLPYRTNQNFNSQLKLLAQLSGINIKLTTHIARHTFRQLLAETEIFDMAVVKRMMGHSSLSDIDGIYYHVTEKGLLDAKCKFEKYLNRNLHE